MSDNSTIPDTLEINGVTYVRAGVEPTECIAKQCSYHEHYLVHYSPDRQGEKLEHEAYHVAEKRCSEAQERVMDWMNKNQDSGDDYKPVPTHLDRQADFWERKVAA